MFKDENNTDSEEINRSYKENTFLNKKRTKDVIKENEERDLFFSLSTCLRDSQEKERSRLERTKYLQFGLSIACTTLGYF